MVIYPDPMVLVDTDDDEDEPGMDTNNGQMSPHALALEALLSGDSHFQGLLDLQPDADDERMVELAIALSLQEQEAGSRMHGGSGGGSAGSRGAGGAASILDRMMLQSLHMPSSTQQVGCKGYM
jgi:E3 ubiquitin-protein ligase UBR4